MEMTGMTTDREKAPLMKALHEVGLAHGVRMVVVAIPMKGGEVQSFLIDHKDDTTVKEVVQKFTGAGVYLIQAAGAAEEYAHKQESEGGSGVPSEAPPAKAHECEEECCLPK